DRVDRSRARLGAGYERRDGADPRPASRGGIVHPTPPLLEPNAGFPAVVPRHLREALRLRGSMTRASAVLAALAAVAVTVPARAQDSQFGMRGLGTPGRFESVRARSTGGAFGPFDAFSPLIEASLADIPRVSASITTGTSWRTVDF